MYAAGHRPDCSSCWSLVTSRCCSAKLDLLQLLLALASAVTMPRLVVSSMAAVAALAAGAAFVAMPARAPVVPNKRCRHVRAAFPISCGSLSRLGRLRRECLGPPQSLLDGAWQRQARDCSVTARGDAGSIPDIRLGAWCARGPGGSLAY